MFEPQEDKKPAENDSAPAIDPRTIPVHTMRDDLGGSGAKGGASKIILFDDKKSGVSGGSNSDRIAEFGPKPQASSPFAENPFAVKTEDEPIEIKRNSVAPSLPNLPKSPVTPNIPNIPNVSNIPNVPRTPNIPNIPNIPNTPRINPLPRTQGVSTIPNTSIVLKEPLKEGSGGKIFKVLAVFLLILGLLGGGYWFYITRYNVSPDDSELIPLEKIINKTPVEVVPKTTVAEKFLADKPNYLMLDVEKMGPIEIQNLLVQKSLEVQEDGKTVPVEFVITDSNNNPIALKIFARLLGITFSAALLDNLQDDFSIYVFPDGGKPRLGVNMVPKNGTKAMADLKIEEKTIVKNLKALFLGEVTESSALPFGDNQYKGVAIRYLNLNAENSLSIDYFFHQGKIIIATSKNAAWAIIDKMGNLGQ